MHIGNPDTKNVNGGAIFLKGYFPEDRHRLIIASVTLHIAAETGTKR